MTLILKHDLDMVKMYLCTQNEVPRLSGSKVTDRQTDYLSEMKTRMVLNYAPARARVFVCVCVCVCDLDQANIVTFQFEIFPPSLKIVCICQTNMWGSMMKKEKYSSLCRALC